MDTIRTTALAAKSLYQKYAKEIAVAFSVVMALLYIVRIFDNNFWGDEAYTALITNKSVGDMVAETAADNHPPLYYLIVQIFCFFLGQSGPVLHFVSVVPYIITLCLALTVIWNKFGPETAMVLIALVSFTDNGITYNVEVRMYSWGYLFVLLSYLALYDVIFTSSAKSYAAFTAASLAAAYTHYYALISVAFFYALLIAMALFYRRSMLKNTLICSGITVAVYLPWFVFLVKAVMRNSKGYWIDSAPSILGCLQQLFKAKTIISIMIFAVFVFSIAAALAYESGLAKTENSGKEWFITIDFSKHKITPAALWIIGGLISILGTIFAGELVSAIFRPMFIVRYLVPVSVVAWLLTGVGISKCRLKYLYTAIVVGLMLIFGGHKFIWQCNYEKELNDRLAYTLEQTADDIQQDDMIITNVSHINWTISDYYYPGVKHELIDMSAEPDLDENTDYWLICDHVVTQEEELLYTQKGYALNMIVEYGQLGVHDVWIYKIAG